MAGAAIFAALMLASSIQYQGRVYVLVGVAILAAGIPVSLAMATVVQVMVLILGTVLTLYLLALFRARYAEERRLNGEIKLHLEAVERRESFQRTLLNNFPFMVWLKDEQGRYLAVNEAFAPEDIRQRCQADNSRPVVNLSDALCRNESYPGVTPVCSIS